MSDAVTRLAGGESGPEAVVTAVVPIMRYNAGTMEWCQRPKLLKWATFCLTPLLQFDRNSCELGHLRSAVPKLSMQ